EGRLPADLQDGQKLTGQQREVEPFKRPDGLPKNLRNGGPGAEIAGQVEEKEGAKKEDTTEPQVRGRGRLEPELPPLRSQLPHLPIPLHPRRTSRRSSRRSGRSMFRAHGSSFHWRR